MNIWDYIKFIWLEVIYSVIAGIYLLRLNMLNKELIFQNFEDPFQMLVYEEWKPIKFFAVALLLFGAGLGILWRRGNQIKYSELIFGEILISIFALILLIAILILIIIFINNPILKAVMVVCGIGVALLYNDAN